MAEDADQLTSPDSQNHEKKTSAMSEHRAESSDLPRESLHYYAEDAIWDPSSTQAPDHFHNFESLLKHPWFVGTHTDAYVVMLAPLVLFAATQEMFLGKASDLNCTVIVRGWWSLVQLSKQIEFIFFQKMEKKYKETAYL